LNDTAHTAWRVTMYEGRNRQIRRSFAALGYTVKGLHRIQFGPYKIGALGKGQFQAVTPVGSSLTDAATGV
jgi:23S rRNA pseudouridine2605 synthase